MSEGIKKYSSILLKGTAAVSLAEAGTKIISILLLPVFTYYLSPEDYGIFAMVSLVISVLALIYNPGMMSATVRLYHATDSENERKILLGSAHRFFLFIPIVPVLIGLIWGPKIFDWIFADFKFYPFGLLALLFAFFKQPTRVWTMLLTLKYKIYITALYNVISVVTSMLITLLLVVVFQMGAMGKVLGMFPGTLLLFIVSLIAIKKYTDGIWSLQSIKKQFLFGLPIIVAVWAYTALDLVGKYQLERMTDLHNVGLYSFGLAVAGMPMFLVLGIKQLWGPIFYENMNKKEYETISVLAKYFVGGLTILALLVVLFSKEAILFLVNERFYDGIPIVGFLVLGVYFNGLLTISNSLLGFKNKFGLISVFSAIAVAINVVLNFLFIPQIAVLGAAISFAIAYFVFFMLGAWHQKETLKIIQAKGAASIPVIVMILITALNFALNKKFSIYSFSTIEFIIKSIALSLTIALFFKTNILRKKELSYSYKMIINLIRRKR